MKAWQRRIGIGLGGVVGLFVLLLGGVYGMSSSAVGTGHAAEPHPFNGAIGNATEGQRLGNLYGCADCHTADLGGQLLIDGMPFARVSAPNLTAGAPEGAFTDEAFEQAVRHGIGRDGRKLFVMPSAEYTYLSDQDVADILAWIRTLPAVERELPARAFGPIGRLMTVMNKVPFQPDIIAADPDARHMDKPAVTDSVQMGYYLTRLCMGCHGADLAGAPPLEPGAPAGPNLTPGGNLRDWTFEGFQQVFATGRTPDGRQLSDAMPWQVIGQANPDELAAVWAYLRSLPARETAVPQ
ncbi:MAG TPA: cytochrome c [Longimicrobiales bacterium]|nr:cytochrome c [Longimicrobiales bacterium]